jgi:hypothetical protein
MVAPTRRDGRRWEWRAVLAWIAVSQFGLVLLGYILVRPQVPAAQVGAYDILIWSYLLTVLVALLGIARGWRWGGRLFVVLLILDWLQPIYDLSLFRVSWSTGLWLLLAGTNTLMLDAVRRATGIQAPGDWLRRWFRRRRGTPS